MESDAQHVVYVAVIESSESKLAFGWSKASIGTQKCGDCIQISRDVVVGRHVQSQRKSFKLLLLWFRMASLLLITQLSLLLTTLLCETRFFGMFLFVVVRVQG